MSDRRRRKSLSIFRPPITSLTPIHHGKDQVRDLETSQSDSSCFLEIVTSDFCHSSLLTARQPYSRNAIRTRSRIRPLRVPPLPQLPQTLNERVPGAAWRSYLAKRVPGLGACKRRDRRVFSGTWSTSQLSNLFFLRYKKMPLYRLEDRT